MQGCARSRSSLRGRCCTCWAPAFLKSPRLQHVSTDWTHIRLPSCKASACTAGMHG
jgi:hypothetical protein